jgi:streptogramin lyase
MWCQPGARMRVAVPFVLVAMVLMAASCTGGSSTTSPTPSIIVAPAPPSPEPTVTAVVQPLPKGVIASIHTYFDSSAPAGLGVAYGSVWAVSHRLGWVYRIDPNKNRISARIETGQDGCGPPMFGFGRVWVNPCDDSTKTVVIDPKTNRLERSFPCIWLLGFGFGTVWCRRTEATNTIERLDPKTLAVVSEVTAGPKPDALAFAGGSAWIVSAGNGTTARVDPSTNKVMTTVHAGGGDPQEDDWALTAYGSVWVNAVFSNPVYRIDPVTDAVTTYRLKHTQLTQFYDAPIVPGQGSLWQRTSDGTVSRFDPATMKVIGHYPADASGGGGYPAVGFGSLWVANFASDTIWRDRVR